MGTDPWEVPFVKVMDESVTYERMFLKLFKMLVLFFPEAD